MAGRLSPAGKDPLALAILPIYAVHPAEHMTVGSARVPALFVRPAAPGPRPAVLIQHGYGSDKTLMVPLAHYLAERGFVALLPDAWGHGERFPQTGPNWMSELTADYFLEVLRHTLASLPACLDVLEAQPDVRSEAMLVTGFSLGAMIALLMGIQDPRVAGVISASGAAAPDVLDISIAGSRLAGEATRTWALAHDAAAHLGRLAPRPLLLQHGRHDDMIPLATTLRLYECARPLYAEHPERLSLMLYDHTHTISPQQIEDAVEWIATFFTEMPPGA
jgi:dienelactone hydrolase